jgi:malate dehydrogenase
MKVSIIGCGNVGSTIALLISLRDFVKELIVVDIVEGLPQGKMLDLSQMVSFFENKVEIKGTNDFKEIKNSQFVIVTAGASRRPGMTRLELLKTNQKILKDISLEIKKFAPSSFVIVVTNPLDVMSYLVYKETGISKNKIMGMAGVLDSVRFKYFLSKELNISSFQIQTFVLGGHGDEMVPLINYTTVSGIPLRKILNRKKIEEIVKMTKNAGGEIVSLVKLGSAYFAPAMSVIKMLESIVFDRKEILPVSVYLEGEYGFSDVFLGVPVKLGKGGVEEIIELKLTNKEKNLLKKSYEVVKEGIKSLGVRENEN